MAGFLGCRLLSGFWCLVIGWCDYCRILQLVNGINRMSLQLFFERLRKERDALGYTQDEMAENTKVSKRSYCAYEAGETAPSAKLLAALAVMGMDVAYLLTGQRNPAAPPPRLTPDEQELLALFRAAPLAVKAAAIGALQGAAVQSGLNLHQSGSGNVQIGQQAGAIHNAGAIGFFTQQKGDKPNARKRSGKG